MNLPTLLQQQLLLVMLLLEKIQMSGLVRLLEEIGDLLKLVKIRVFKKMLLSI